MKFLFITTDIVILLLPIFFIIGAPATNFATLILSLCFLYFCFKNNKWNLFKKKWVIFFIIFWLYNIFNSFFSDDIINALRASFFYIRFLLFSMAIIYLGLNFFKIKKILIFWIIIIFFVVIDINFQYYFGVDFFGYEAYLTRPRFSGPFGEELVAGAYLSRFFPFLLALIFFFKDNFKLEMFLFILSFYCLFIIMLTGERSALVFSVSFLMMYFFYIFRKDFKKILLICFTIFVLLILSIQNEMINKRYTDLFRVVSNFENSSYGKLYYSGYRIWKNHKINGVGFKNFRVNCDQELIDLIDNNHQLCSTHPHNLYLELLSETGIIGITLFILIFYYIFKQIYLSQIIEKKFTNFKAANLFAIIMVIWPIITSGSFYTSWGGLYMWIYIGFLFNENIQKNYL